MFNQKEGYINTLFFKNNMVRSQLKIEGMHCKSCEVLLKDSLEEIPDVKVLKADHKKGFLEVEHPKEKIEQIKSLIKKEGYSVKK